MTTHHFPAGAPGNALQAHYQPVIRYNAAAARASSGQRSGGLVFAGAVFLFSAVLLAISFGVTVHHFVGLDAHWAANTSLTTEARELGLAAVKHETWIRMAVSGPAGFLLGVAGLVALVTGARRR